MVKLTRHACCILLLQIIGILSIKADGNEHNATISPALIQLEKVHSLRHTDPIQAIAILEQSVSALLQEGDTAHAIEALRIHASIGGNMADYKISYDQLWKALLLANEANLEYQKALVYIDIGRHYSFYKRRVKAIECFQISLDINKRLVRAGKLDEIELAANYYAFCSTYRELNELEQARIYLDSCLFIKQTQLPYNNFPYLKFQLACIQTAEQQYGLAIQTFQGIQAWFEQDDPTHLVMFYTYLADAYQGVGELKSSEHYYKRALEISVQYQMHLDFSPIVHEKLSHLYLKQGDYKSAYQRLRNMKDLDAKYFDSRSANNQSVLEIQDAFLKEQQAQQALIQTQKLERLEHEEDVWFLQRVILTGSILFIVTIALLYFSYMRDKFKADKLVLEKQKQLELEKANEVLEMKNKELAASALKLIEKDENLSLLKNKIKEANGHIDVNELKKLMRTISISNNRNWKEFETRFISVNQSFYTRLQERFPNLSPKDLKLCALIKLNFSSKEMAKLLGISVESAHTSRYRLRKKLKLTRDINLTEFINKI